MGGGETERHALVVLDGSELDAVALAASRRLEQIEVRLRGRLAHVPLVVLHRLPLERHVLVRHEFELRQVALVGVLLRTVVADFRLHHV